MDVIRFQAEVGRDQVIRPPEGVSLPSGRFEVTVTPCADAEDRPKASKLTFPNRADYATVWDWLQAVGIHAEQLDTSLPTDMAQNHDYYAHGKPRK
jgi:hypothetical protein